MFGHVVKDMVRDSAETEAALEQANAQQGDRPNPLHTAFVAHGKTTLLVAGVASFWPTVFYVSFVWIATFETTLVGPPLSSAFTINTVMVVLSTLLFPVLGVVADRVGPSRFMRAGTALAVVAALPAFAMVDRGDVFGMIVGQFVLMLISCAFGPGLPAWMVDAAPVECRYTIVGVGYNLAQALLGGTAPLLATAAYGLGGSAVWTGVYFACVAALAGICLCVDARDKRTRGYQLQASSADDSPEPSRP